LFCSVEYNSCLSKKTFYSSNVNGNPWLEFQLAYIVTVRDKKLTTTKKGKKALNDVKLV
jgi:hypothetical protein